MPSFFRHFGMDLKQGDGTSTQFRNTVDSGTLESGAVSLIAIN